MPVDYAIGVGTFVPNNATMVVAGGIVQMIAHGFVSGAMFLCIGVLYDRVHSREISAYGENTKVADPGGQWLHDLTDLGGSPDLLRGFCFSGAGACRLGCTMNTPALSFACSGGIHDFCARE